MVEDLENGVVVGDESDDLHLAAASGTGQGVELVGNGLPGFCGHQPKRDNARGGVRGQAKEKKIDAGIQGRRIGAHSWKA